MLSQYYITSNTADFSRMPKGIVIRALLDMVEQCLLDFPEYVQSLAGYDETATELFFNNEFSHRFQIVFQKYGGRGCTFHPESASQQDLLGKNKKKGIPPRVDFGIRLNHSGDRIMLVEGKRLHNPYDKQYVSGNTGGIARFKQEQHGADVDISCIIGYVQTNTFAFWHEKINTWIRAENILVVSPPWNDDDLLPPPYEIAEHLLHCVSRHQRISKAAISLHHFWVKVI